MVSPNSPNVILVVRLNYIFIFLLTILINVQRSQLVQIALDVLDTEIKFLTYFHIKIEWLDSIFVFEERLICKVCHNHFIHYKG